MIGVAVLLGARWLRRLGDRPWRAGVQLLLTLAAVPLLLSDLGGARPAPAAPRAAARGDVFVVILDSLRADHAGPEQMPALAAFARGGVRFADAHSPSIMTEDSLPGLIGLDSAEIVRPRTRFAPVRASFAGSLPGRMLQAGYRIHLLSDYPATTLEGLEAYRWDHVAANPANWFRLANLPTLVRATVQGDEITLRRTTGDKHPFGPGGWSGLLDDLLARPHDRPGFYLIHLAVPHEPYAMPPYRPRTLALPDEAEVAAANDRFRRETGSGPQVDVAGRRRYYPWAVRAADEQLAALLETIRRRRSGQQPLVIVTSDHGETFGEHGAVGHGRSLYAAAHQVPLVVAGPGFTPGQVVDRPVSGAQLPATIYDWAGLERSDRSLLRDVAPDPPRRTVAVWFPRGTMVQTGHWRLIWTELRYLLDRPASWAHRQEYELFDLSRDPGEQVNLAARQPAPAELAPLLEALQTHWGIPAASREAARARRTAGLAASGAVEGAGR